MGAITRRSLTVGVLVRDGKRLRPGQVVADFRGEQLVLKSWDARKNRIYVAEWPERPDSYLREFYPSVINASFKEG